MCEVKAKATFHNHNITDIPVINPGAWFGKCWLLEIGGSVTPLFLIVEADNVQDELADNEQFGHMITVPEDDLGDYPEDERQYGPSGQIVDLDWLMVHGAEGVECPFPCRYFGDGLPDEGMLPTDYCDRDDN